MSFLYRIDANICRWAAKSWGTHTKNTTAIQCLDKRSQMASFLHITHIRVDSSTMCYMYIPIHMQMCVSIIAMQLSDTYILCVHICVSICVYLCFYNTFYMQFYDMAHFDPRFCHLFNTLLSRTSIMWIGFVAARLYNKNHFFNCIYSCPMKQHKRQIEIKKR